MGSFNTIRAEARCPRCASLIEVRVQFKFSDCWQYEYAIGDVLRWGGNDVGVPGQRRVVVDGIAENACPHCGFDDEWGFYVSVESDKVTRVIPADGRYDFVGAWQNYLVLDTAHPLEGKLLDARKDVIGIVRVSADDGFWSGAIDLGGVAPNVVSLYARFELVRDDVLSAALETEVAQLDPRFQISWKEGPLFLVDDLRVLPSQRLVSFRSARSTGRPRSLS